MKRSIDLSGGMWSRVDRMAKQVSRTVPEFVEHCLKRRLKKLEKKHSTRIFLEGEFNAGKKAKKTKKSKPKPAARKRTTAKKPKLTAVA